MSLNRAIELFEQEHGGCELNTCACIVAYRLGYRRWAVKLYASTGAGSEQFYHAFDKAAKAKDWVQDTEEERKALCKEEHVDCPHCHAVIWLPEEVL
jgi:hypothetical protein